MGHNSKKKKHGGGRKGKGRVSSKDNLPIAIDDPNLLAEEITALNAIFQEDFRLVSESPHTQFTINLRPYSNDTGSEDLNVSAVLLVRCLPGYPYKCPKLRIVLEKGLSKDDTDHLLSLLLDQANSNAHEGRVMIFNLVEAAQEFLSEIAPTVQSVKSVTCLAVDTKEQWLQGNAIHLSEKRGSNRAQFVYGLIDLFSDLCGEEGSWDHQGHGTNVISDNLSRFSHDDKSRDRDPAVRTHALDTSKIGYGDLEKHFSQYRKPDTSQDRKNPIPQSIKKLDAVDEVNEDDNNSISSTDSSSMSREELSGKGTNSVNDEDQLEEFVLLEQTEKIKHNGVDDEHLGSPTSVSGMHDRTSLTVEKDLIMIHLLHLACSSKGPLTNALHEITSELFNLGIISEEARDLAIEPSLVFNKAFGEVFRQHMVSSPISHFWKAIADFGGENSSSLPTSRYLNDFEEVRSLGHGGFGHVLLCKNKLDGRQYAVKKICLKDSLPVNDKILREVATLSRLQHQHVVRYYQAWFETEVGCCCGESTWGSQTGWSSNRSYSGVNSANTIVPEAKQESTYLYIQMEYCPRTLRHIFESYNGLFDKEFTWHLFRQIVEGLAHIHGQGIIHRDLTPSNIFFDARNDIKIGDFGLAKFLKLEQMDHDPLFTTENIGVSMDGTGRVGTYFYTAPEIEQGWPQINEKVDMYSLGVVFFELWHPFSTAMERHSVLSDLKLKGVFPPTWAVEFPEQASLLRRLMAPSPSDRPSAKEVLQHALPPRMEDEWLNDILRTMQTAEDTYVYDRVVSTIFDEERLIMKSNRQHGGRRKIIREDSLFIQYTESDTEIRDHVIEVTKEVFRQHGAKKLEIAPMRVLDENQQFNRQAVKLLTRGGNMLELCHELRSPFVNWVVANQKLSFKRYEISWVYREAIGRSTPNRYLQGDFDIIGGATALAEAEIIKVAMDIVTRYLHSGACDIRLNHGHILDAIWSWIGIDDDLRQNVAKLLSLMGSSSPQSSARKSRWVLIRRQLLQELNLSEAVVNRLQTVDLRFCGSADLALARLRGALPFDKPTRKAFEELSALISSLRIWRIENNVSIDVLMPPTEDHHRELFFQIYLIKENSVGSFPEGTLLAVGGRYDHLVQQMWNHEYKSSPPGAVGVSVALEKILLHHTSAEVKSYRNEQSTNILICSKGGGGLLLERMELVAELWEAKIRAEFVLASDPSLTEQYEYANEHDIKCLVIVTESGLSQTGSVKVRHLELKKEKEVEREELVKFLTEAISTQFRKLSSWN